MSKNTDNRGIASSRDRIAELRESRRRTLEPLNSSRTTVIINMLIGITSGIIFLVGITVVVRFLVFQRASMGENSFRIFIGLILSVGVFWFIYLAIRIRGHLARLSEISSKKAAHTAQSDVDE